ncbi:MAG: zinc metalloprotease HtpX [Betaproteobacteria bacterium]|nr:zinc metalloprotease HtpX [Betaproteobacteria bacterium]
MGHVGSGRHVWVNGLHSALVLAAMGGVLAVLGWLLGGRALMVSALVVGAGVAVAVPRMPSRFLLRRCGARYLAATDAPELHFVLGELARRAGLPATPPLFLIPSAKVNAFTVGKRGDMSVALTDGLVRGMTSRELAAVLAHEVSHVRHNDVGVMALAQLLTRFSRFLSILGQIILVVNLPFVLLSRPALSWFTVFALILSPTLMAFLQLMLSRVREFDADRGAADLTGDPEGMAMALEKIERDESRPAGHPFSLRHLLGILVFRTHPRTDERIRRLAVLALSLELRGEAWEGADSVPRSVV